MKTPCIAFLLLTLYSCTNSEPASTPDDNKQAVDTTGNINLRLFAPGTLYYTTGSDDNNNPTWTEKGFSIFATKTLDSLNHQQFELLDVYGNDQQIVVFNELFYSGDTIKHMVLDTLCNFSDFAADIPNHANSVGVFSKDELTDLNTKGIDRKSVISVVIENTSFKHDIDSAIALHKKKKKDPFEVINAKRNVSVLKAWFANTKTKKIELIK